MTAQDLKNSILQLAMQGKLAPQDPNDEPASELLKRIKAEKARLIKEGKIKKEKPSDPITEEEKSFEIPENWVWVRLSQIVYNFGQKIPDEEFCYIDVGSIDNNDGRLSETNTRIKPENAPSRARKVVIRGAILYSCVRPYLLNTCIVDRDFPRPPIASTAFAVLMPYEGIQNKYLHQYLRSPSFVAYTNITSTGQAYPAINDRRLYDAVIPVPPYEEQKRIVAKIEELLPLVERYDESEKRLLELNKKFPDELRKAILQQAVQGKLTEQDPHDEPASELLKRIGTEKGVLISKERVRKEKPYKPVTNEDLPFEIPDSWKAVRIGEVGIYKKGPFGSSLTKSMFIPKDDSAIKVYEQKNAIQKDFKLGEYYIKNEYFQFKMKTFEVYPGDVIVSCAGTIGETYILPEGIEKGIINQALMRMKIVESLNIDYFLLYFDYVLKLDAQSKSKGSAIRNIPPFDVFKNMVLPIPPIEEQARIVDRVKELLPVCDSLILRSINSC